MRAVRDAWLPHLAAVMGVRPWETDDLTIRDLLALCEALRRQAEDASRG